MLDGVEPTEESIKSGDYFLSRPFVMATNGENFRTERSSSDFL